MNQKLFINNSLLNQKHYDLKNDFIINIQKFFKDQSEQYDLYFLTVTFSNRDSDIKREYRKYFEKFCQRLNNCLISGKDYKRSAVLIMLPEYEPKNRKLHFHGIIMIHKTTSKNFMRRCHSGYDCELVEIKNKYTKEKKRTIRPHLLLSKYIMNPFVKYKSQRKRLYQIVCEVDDFIKQNPFNLTVASSRIYKIPTKQDTHNVVQYATKKLTLPNIDYDDIIICKREKPNKNDRLYVLKRKRNAKKNKGRVNPV